MSLMLQLPSFQFSFTFLLLFLFLILKQWRRSKAQLGPATKLPPGPWKLPLLGNLHQMVGHPPHHIIANLAKKHGPIMHLRLGQAPVVVVSSPRIAEEVLKKRDPTFAQRPQFFASKIMSYKGGSSMLCSPYNDSWRQLRKICLTEVLSAKRIQSFKSVREDEVQGLIESIQSCVGEYPINLRNKMTSFIGNLTSRIVIGSKMGEDEEKFISALDEIISAGGFGVHDMFPSLEYLRFISGKKTKYERLHQRRDRILDAIIKKHKSADRKSPPPMYSHRSAGQDNLTDVLFRIQERYDLKVPITIDTIKDFISEIFGTAFESTSTTVEWAMSEMMKNPVVMEKAQAEVRQALKGKTKIDESDIQELGYLKAIVKETVRLHPPVPLIAREARERCEINSYEIPEKTTVLVSVWAMCRDPAYWVDADSFQPERFLGSSSSISFGGNDFEFIPFGAGRRVCPGILYATAVVELSLAQLLYHFNWQLPNGTKPEELDMTDTLAVTLKKKKDLCLIANSFI